MRILHHCPKHCLLYYLIPPLCLVSISLTGAYWGVQSNIYEEIFDIPSPFPYAWRSSLLKSECGRSP